MPNRTIVHFEIPANDLERLARFYEQAFGWSFARTDLPGFRYWRITTGPAGRSLGGGMYPKMSPGEGPRNFVGVEDLDEAIVLFRRAGGSEVVGKQEIPGIGWSFVGQDPEGNPIAIFQPAGPMRSRRSSRRPAPRRTPAKKRRRSRS